MPWRKRYPAFLDQLLTPVDVVRPTRERRVGHQVQGERGDVAGADHAADREGAAELLPARLYLIAEQPRRERRVDEAGGDQVHAHRGDLEREGGDELGH